MEVVPSEVRYVVELEDQLWRRGFTPSGIAYVLGLLRDQHPPESSLHLEFERVRKTLAG